MKEPIVSQREEILRVARSHGVTSVRVFGSFARDEAGPDSDVDLLVDVGAATSPWFPAGLELDLEDLLGRSVDIVTESALHPFLRAKVLREAVPL